EVVRTHLKIGEAFALVFDDREEIFATSADRRGGLAREERDVWIRSAKLCVLLWLVVVAEDVDRFLETVVSRFGVICACCNGSRRILFMRHLTELDGESMVLRLSLFADLVADAPQ